jgi:hypothetical protein
MNRFLSLSVALSAYRCNASSISDSTTTEIKGTSWCVDLFAGTSNLEPAACFNSPAKCQFGKATAQTIYYGERRRANEWSHQAHGNDAPFCIDAELPIIMKGQLHI